MRSAPLAILLAVATSGCTSQLTQAGHDVRRVEGAAVSRCTQVGVVSATGGNGPSTADNEDAALNDVRNQVAKLGGNAYAVTSREVHAFLTRVHADAYRCPQWEPVRGLAPVERRGAR